MRGMRYVIGIIAIALGFIFIWKTDWFINSLGRVAWAEQKLGGGGTWLFYKILGVVVIIVAFMIMTGEMNRLLDLVFGN